MHIILMSERLGRTISFRLDHRHGLALSLFLSGAVAWAAYLGFHFGSDNSLAVGPQTQTVAQQQGPRLDQLALRVGELQARLARITDVGERVAKKVGVPLPDLAHAAAPGEGGPLISADAQPASAEEVARLLDGLTRQFDRESDRLTVLDTELLTRQARLGHLPMDRPVLDGYVSSPFGVRPDPFTGKLARHEGLDFSDRIGAPIHAAESGIVITARLSPDYGNEVEIDHGNGLVTRYGHCSRLLVKEGDMVKRGQEIAEVGSTGRSTGPHVHFEVRKDGVAVNPVLYLSRRD
ncbi:MAG TPA: M23 family metallopeptidase [Parasulfuritortus sp.]